MRFRVTRRTQFSLHHFAVEVEHHDVRRRECFVVHTARLDGPKAAGAIDPAYITPREAHEAGGGQGAVGFADLLAEFFESHGLASVFPDFEQFHFKDQRLIRADVQPGAAFAIGKVAGDEKARLASLLHGL